MSNGRLASRWQLGFLCGLLLIGSLPLLNASPSIDMASWTHWTAHADSLGVVSGFAENRDNYPPLGPTAIVAAVRVGRRIGVGSGMSIKLSMLVFLVVTAVLFWGWTRDPWLALGLYASLVLSSVVLAYADIYFAPSLLLCLWALKERRLTLFAVAYSVACLTKYQPLIVGPFLAVYVIETERLTMWWPAVLRGLARRVALPSAAVILPVVAVFGIRPVVLSFKLAVNHPFLSANALNLEWILTHALHVLGPGQFGPLDHGASALIMVPPHALLIVVPKALFLVAYAALVMDFKRQPQTFENLVRYALLGYLAYVIVCPGVHENHFFLAGLLAFVLAWVDRAELPTAVIVALMANINLALFHGLNGGPSAAGRVLGHAVDSALLFSLINVAFFAFLVYAALAGGRRSAN